MPDGQIDTAAKMVTLSDSAVERLKVLGQEDAHTGQMLRVAVDGGGCS
ncbi:MAG: iron-sulfur cluster assembly accessory protein, partial [Rhodospirillaceae bacterium]|nr:iron-sulfur cluster assembly accessory protein [Rhodospirillaceae bacterium]